MYHKRMIIICVWIGLLVCYGGLAQAQEEPSGERSVIDAIENNEEHVPEDKQQVNEDQTEQPKDQNEVAPNETLPIQNELLTNDQPSFFVIILQMIGALIVIVALIYLLLRFINQRSRSFRTHQTLQNIGGVSLGQNRSVQLIKVGGRLLIVGVGESIHLLKEIDDENEAEKIIEQQHSMLGMDDGLAGAISKKLSPQKKQDAETPTFSTILDKQLEDVASTHRKNVQEAIKEYKR